MRSPFKSQRRKWTGAAFSPPAEPGGSGSWARSSVCGGPRVGAPGGGCSGMRRFGRMGRTTPGSVSKARICISPWQAGQRSGWTS